MCSVGSRVNKTSSLFFFAGVAGQVGRLAGNGRFLHSRDREFNRLNLPYCISIQLPYFTVLFTWTNIATTSVRSLTYTKLRDLQCNSSMSNAKKETASYRAVVAIFKAIVHLKMNSFWKCAHPRAIQYIDEFVSSSDLEKFCISSFDHQWMLCSEWVPSEWESKQLLKTSQ